MFLQVLKAVFSSIKFEKMVFCFFSVFDSGNFPFQSETWIGKNAALMRLVALEITGPISEKKIDNCGFKSGDNYETLFCLTTRKKYSRSFFFSSFLKANKKKRTSGPVRIERLNVSVIFVLLSRFCWNEKGSFTT